ESLDALSYPFFELCLPFDLLLALEAAFPLCQSFSLLLLCFDLELFLLLRLARFDSLLDLDFLDFFDRLELDLRVAFDLPPLRLRLLLALLLLLRLDFLLLDLDLEPKRPFFFFFLLWCREQQQM